jgi:single-stranded-DNA-specific exonuclease
MKTWRLLPHDSAAVERLARSLNISPVVAQLLLNRQLAEPEAARDFLDAPLTGLHAPERLPGVEEAVDRIMTAVREQQRICVYGDYDVDGISGTAILLQVLRLLGSQPDAYVPHRLEEGYGLNVNALQQIAQAGTKVVITVDCGIASLAEADEARRFGMDLIITDHHEPRETLPDAAVRIHPRLPGGDYPFGALSGAGVAFKLAWALAKCSCGSDKVSPPFRELLLDSIALAALGTIADVVPLLGENRIFVRHGLSRIRQAPSAGVKALLHSAGVNGHVRAMDVGFRLAPRLNAAGRLGCARLVVELLTTTSAQRATDLANFLEGQNQQRQLLERKMLAQAREMLGDHDAAAIVLANADWHAGVLGIVASRLVDRYARPTLLIALPSANGDEEGVAQGSGRSIPGFPLHEALRACDAHLVSHGGHQMAAGFKVRPDDVPALREAFTAYAARHYPDGPPPPCLTLDAETPLAALTLGMVQDLDRLEPYGSANARPLLLAGAVQLVGEPRKMGGGERHLNFRVSQGQTRLRAVAFGMAERIEELTSAGGQCCLAFTPKINEWQGRRSVELEVTDFQPGPTARLD